MDRLLPRGPVLLAVLVSLLLVGAPAPAPADPGTMMSLFPNAGQTGAAQAVTVTTRSALAGGDVRLHLESPLSDLVHEAPLVRRGATGSSWSGAVPLVHEGTPAAPGLYDARVTQDGVEVEACTRCFTVLSAGAPGADARGLSARQLLRGQGRELHVAGRHFTEGTVVEALYAGKAAPGVRVTGADVLAQGGDTANRLTRRIDVAADAPLGHWSLRFTGTDGRTSTCTSCLTVTAPASKVEPTGVTNDLPRVVHLDVDGVLPRTAKLVLTWAGASADRRLDLVAASTSVAPGPVSRLTGRFDFTGATPARNGYHAGYLLPDGSTHGCEGLCRFTVEQVAAPAVTSLSAPAQRPGETARLALKGTGFTRGSQVTLDGDPDVVVEDVRYGSATALTAVVRARPSAGPSSLVLTVSNPDGKESAPVDYAVAGEPVTGGATGSPVPRDGAPEDDPDPELAPPVPTVHAAPAVLGAQQQAVLTGQAAPGATLDVVARPAGSPAGRVLDTLVVPDDGRWTSRLSPARTTRVHVVARNGFGRTRSPEVVLQVRSSVTFAAACRGRTCRFTGRVVPALADQLVTVHYRTASRTVIAQRLRTARDGRFTGPARTFGRPGELRLHARAAASEANAAGTSAELVRVLR